MSKFMNPITSILAVFLFLGCTSSEKRNYKIEKPNKELATKHHLNIDNIQYQFYQKFGFTDICEHTRILSTIDNAIFLTKKLPISKNDLAIINNFPNKTDSIIGLSFSPIFQGRDLFSDIELEHFSYSSDSSFVLHLQKGKYQIEQSEKVSKLTIYDENSRLFYFEIYKCY